MALAFNITCPELSQRAIRSEYVCNESSQHQYSCLFDEHKQKYVELCSHPDFVRRGKYLSSFIRGKMYNLLLVQLLVYAFIFYYFVVLSVILPIDLSFFLSRFATMALNHILSIIKA